MFATEDDIAGDDDQYDCQTCAVADALDGLWPENMAAWTISRQILSRFTVDQRCVALALDRLTREMDAGAVLELIQRLAVIYDELYPAPARSQT